MTIRQEARQDPFQLLVAEHALIHAQIRRTIAAIDGRAAERKGREGLRALHEMTRHHIAREEVGLYPLCERLLGSGGAISVLRMDHAAIRADLAGLDSASREELPLRLESSAARVEAHTAREERVLFPMISALLPGSELDALAWQMRSLPATHGDEGG